MKGQAKTRISSVHNHYVETNLFVIGYTDFYSVRIIRKYRRNEMEDKDLG